MTFNFNMGQIGDTSYIENICKTHPECKDCPVTQTGAIKLDETMVSCSTEIIKHIQRKAGKNV